MRLYYVLLLVVLFVSMGCDEITIHTTEKLARDGQAEYQVKLGKMYENGYRFPQDYIEAAKWYEKAARQDDDRGLSNLGRMYYFGRGVKQSYEKALVLYRLGAKQKNINALNGLGWMYKKGLAVPEDQVVAYALFNVCAYLSKSKDSPCSKDRDEVVTSLNDEDVINGQRLARDLVETDDVLSTLDNWVAVSDP